VEKSIPTDKARQGRLGKQVLYVLVASLVLAALAWGAVEIYGEQIDPPAAETGAAAGATAPAAGTTAPAN
jgi:hypothetical protein